MSHPILHYSRMEWPTSWSKMFGRKAPLLLEIGFGSGHFLINWAKRHPESNVLGLEISLPSLRRAEKKMQVAQLSNLRILQADSRTALWLLFSPQTISEVVINFPDPWPKASHHHRRLISDNFLHLLSTRMQEGGLLDIATDHEEYAAIIAGCLENSPFFDNRLQDSYLSEDDSRLQTKYEKIALTEGRSCHYFKYRRNSNFAPDLFLIPEVSEVPHVVLSCPMPLEEIGRQFRPFSTQAENLTINYLDAFQSAKERLLLVEIYVSEEPYHQRICLSMRSRKGGDLVVSLYPVGFPRPTPGLHLAIFYIVQWMQTLNPEIKVVSSTLNVADAIIKLK